MKKFSIVFAFVCTFQLSACADFAYDVLQDASDERCKKILTETDRAACQKKKKDDYATYMKKREEVMNGSKKE